MEELNNCPICDYDKFKPFLSCTDYTVSRETFKVVQCESCGFRFTNPRPNEKEIGKYYESEEYISHSGTNKGIVNKVYQAVRNYTIKQKVKLINKQLATTNHEPRTILDIGCGTGEFLNACKTNGWNVTGIEPSEVARKTAKTNYGIAPYPSLWDLHLPSLGDEGDFNVITLWHVLEHIHQLGKTIEQMNKILFDDGVLIIAVPNCSSLDAKKYVEHWAAWDLPRHLYHFTEKDIKTTFKKFGFQLTEVLPMKFDSYYVSLLSEKYKTASSDLTSRMRSYGAGFFNGLKSNLSAYKKDIGYSSQIYVLKKGII